MLKIKQRTSAEGVAHHRQNPVRVYEDCPIQGDRIARSRRMVQSAIMALGPAPKHIVELCGGTADISGSFVAEGDKVTVIDCYGDALDAAIRRFPRIECIQANVETMAPWPTDILVLCETLEHLADPPGLVAKWLPLARASIISHPVDERADSAASAGDHQWSFTEDDFAGWFMMGDHRLIQKDIFRMGSYRIALGYGLSSKI